MLYFFNNEEIVSDYQQYEDAGNATRQHGNSTLRMQALFKIAKSPTKLNYFHAKRKNLFKNEASN